MITKRDRVISDLAIALAFLGIWRERNNKTFNGKASLAKQTFLYALLSHLIDPISFQTVRGSERGGSWIRFRWGMLLIVSQEAHRAGDDTDSDDM